MARVKRGTIGIKRRRKILKAAKGFRHGRSTKERLARETLYHAGVHAYAHRKTKKRDMRMLWNIKISAGLMPYNLSYSKFIGALKKKGIILDRKVLAHLAEHNPDIFEKVVTSAKG